MPIHRVFEAQAARTPDRIAAVHRDRQISYGELNRRANQVARALVKRGVGADVLVGLFMDRSLEMVVGLLGILKAGGAYLPLDPSYPLPRLAWSAPRRRRYSPQAAGATFGSSASAAAARR